MSIRDEMDDIKQRAEFLLDNPRERIDLNPEPSGAVELYPSYALKLVEEFDAHWKRYLKLREVVKLALSQTNNNICEQYELTEALGDEP